MRKFVLSLATIFLSLSLFAQSSDSSEKSKVVLDNIFARKSVRNFKTDANGNAISISKDTLDIILRAGMAAPTARNKQPWEFFVFSGKEQMNLLAEKLPYAKMLKTAGAAIVVIGNPDISTLWYLDCSAATENILLAIEALGLGGVWTAGYPYDDRVKPIKEALGIPDPYIPLCVIPVGYPSGKDMPKDKWKAERIHYNKW